MKRRLARVNPWFLAAAALWAGSAGMNATYGWGKGSAHGLPFALVFLVISVSIDLFKGRLPMLMAGAGATKRIALASAWVLCLSWSLTAALGFLATAQDAERGARTSEAQAYDAASAEKTRIEAGLSDLKPRSASAIEADVAAILGTPVKGTKTVAALIACDKVGTSEYGAVSKEWCPKLDVLYAEKTEIDQRAKLEDRLRALDTVMASAKPVTIDPTATLIEKVTFGLLAKETVQIALVILGVLTIEYLSAVGFALVAKPKKKRTSTAAGAQKKRPARAARKRVKPHVIRGQYPKLVAQND